MKSRRGVTLFELMIGIGISTMATVALMNLMSESSYSNLQMHQVRILMELRNQVIYSIKSPSAWANTIALPANAMGCIDPIQTAVFCAQAPMVAGQTWRGNQFDLLDQNSESVGTNGPFQYSLFWEPVCTVYPCLDKQVEIVIHAVLSIDTTIFKGVPLNSANYNIHLVRPQAGNTIESACLANNGVYDSTAQTCRPRFAGQSCPNNQYVKGINADGSLVCESAFTGACGNDEVLLGIDANGAVICGAEDCTP